MPLLVKARNLFSTRRVEADLDEEVRSHLELLIDENTPTRCLITFLGENSSLFFG